MKNSLSVFEVGKVGVITQFLDEVIASRLMSMGVLLGSNVRVIRKAPFKGGIYLRVDGQNMIMREREAQTIILSMVENSDS